MATSSGTWKRRERDAAGIFGARRQVLSGSGARDDRSRSDSTHPGIFLETKLRAASAVRNLWEKTAVLAKKEKKVPVLVIYTKFKQGGLLVIHQDDLADVARELAAENEDGEES